MSTAHSRSVPRLPLYSGVALATVGFITGVAVEDGPVLCLFRRCTGGYCPGCGGTRAARALFSGDVGEAWAQHPWTVLLAVQIVILGPVAPALSRSVRTVVSTPLALANIMVGLVIWMVRLGMGSIPMPFS